MLNADSLPLQLLFTPTMLINIATCSVLKVKLSGQSPRSNCPQKKQSSDGNFIFKVPAEAFGAWEI